MPTIRRPCGQLSKKYPDDLDAATLFADSMMNLRPWKLWNADGTPEEGTDEIVATLESVLRRDPNHIGAMHLYIHAVEASPHPERALRTRIGLPPLAPAAGHLVHMPAHIYERTGNYDGAREQNAAAAKADEDYAAATGTQGIYGMMYYSHNLHFGAIAASMQGHCAEAQQSGRPAGRQSASHAEGDADGRTVCRRPTGDCGSLRAMGRPAGMSEPAAQTPVLKAFWLYSRGIALAARGRTSEAEALQKQLAAIEKAEPRDEVFMPPVENHSWLIFHIAGDVLGREDCGGEGGQDGSDPIAAGRRGQPGSTPVRRAVRLVLPGARIAGRHAATGRRSKGSRACISRGP